MNTVKKVPERSCVGCGVKKEKKALVRIVREVSGEYHLDPGGRRNGRGAYICRDAACLETAIRRKALDRAFRESMTDAVIQVLREEFEELDR